MTLTKKQRRLGKAILRKVLPRPQKVITPAGRLLEQEVKMSKRKPRKAGVFAQVLRVGL